MKVSLFKDSMFEQYKFYVGLDISMLCCKIFEEIQNSALLTNVSFTGAKHVCMLATFQAVCNKIKPVFTEMK